MPTMFDWPMRMKTLTFFVWSEGLPSGRDNWHVGFAAGFSAALALGVPRTVAVSSEATASNAIVFIMLFSGSVYHGDFVALRP